MRRRAAIAGAASALLLGSGVARSWLLTIRPICNSSKASAWRGRSEVSRNWQRHVHADGCERVMETSGAHALEHCRVHAEGPLLVVTIGLLRLPRQLPQKMALHMALTGRRMPAEEAHRLGLVNELAPTGGDVLAVARALAAEVLKGAPMRSRRRRKSSPCRQAAPTPGLCIASRTRWPPCKPGGHRVNARRAPGPSWRSVRRAGSDAAAVRRGDGRHGVIFMALRAFW